MEGAADDDKLQKEEFEEDDKLQKEPSNFKKRTGDDDDKLQKNVVVVVAVRAPKPVAV